MKIVIRVRGRQQASGDIARGGMAANQNMAAPAK